MNLKMILLGLLSLIQVAQGEYPSEARREWLAERRTIIDRAKESQNDQAIEDLSRIIRSVGRDLDSSSDEAKDLYSEAQALLLSIPGHAEYLSDKIRRIMDDEVAKKDVDGRDRIRTFERLEHLPSPETVKVLGELLYDDRDPWAGRDFHDTGPPIPNFKRASMALTQLGIRKPPVKNQYPGRSGFEVEEVETWKVWYEQVRDGTRTFSFEGDEAIYNLSGRTTVEKDGPMRSRPDRKPSSPYTAEPAEGASSFGTPVIIAVLLLIGIVFSTIQQMRKRAA